MRKLAQRKTGFPQNAEVCPDENRLSAKCGSSPREKTAFRKMRKSAPDEKRLSANCGSSPRKKTAFRKMRFLHLRQRRQTAPCGFLPDEKTTNRKLRKPAQRKNSFPHDAVLCFKKMFSAFCGKISVSSAGMTVLYRGRGFSRELP